MDKTRVAFIVEVNLDPVPGWGDNEGDWRIHIMQRLGLYERDAENNLLSNPYDIQVRYEGIVHQAAPIGAQLQALASEIMESGQEEVSNWKCDVCGRPASNRERFLDCAPGCNGVIQPNL